MRRKIWLPGGVVLGAFLAAVLLGGQALAQTSPPAAVQTVETVELLRRGRQLEIERRWADALVHYEDAVRQFPGDASLQRRFQFTRLHYDLQRRYEDRSYREVLSRLSLAGALDVYSEVLLKIQAHYVEAPHWKELVERGTNSFEVALSESAFLGTHAPGVESKAVDEFRRELRRALGPRVIQTRDEARDAVATAATLAQSRLGITPHAVVLEYLCGATNALDAYSSYLTPSQLNDIHSQIEGNFVGLGVELKADEGALLIVRVIPGSPAERCGICAGDRITSVDGQSTRELTTDQAASLLQGQAGSVAELTIVSPAGQTRQASISRERVEVPSVEDVRLVDRAHGIGYLKLSSFQKTTSRDVDTALWELHRAGMQGLIVDLRTNPGGLLVAAVEVADKFVDRGVIVATRGRNVQENFTYSAHEIGTWRMPLVVLIDHESASAAEILAGAIRDLRRGTIVGTRSYGKGSVQSIFPLRLNDSGVRLTTAKFYSPAGHPYSRVGVQPDVVVHHVARPIGASGQLPPSAEEDPVLSAGLQAARQLVTQPVGARVETVR